MYNPNQITEWERPLEERAPDAFGAAGTPSDEPPVDLKGCMQRSRSRRRKTLSMRRAQQSETAKH
ncbi:MAG TPA: hypothetical protein VJU59_12310 [Paraburkholderia sp.]|uniref:hypothetical protein n=1 Tax=Paraburkholderia sp. TaxID=1926495 RepID=UPI002B49B66D|nr:hypothetical protein [Paraburkholderia sp.]HKR40440.1 hypothetical protein [Paraburkholderia sp.]